MYSKWSILLASFALASAASVGLAQERAANGNRSRIDVEHYTIDAEVNPSTQVLTATAQVRFVPLDDLSTASFELNNALNVSKVVDETGRQIPATRSQQDFTVRLNFPDRLPKGKETTITFSYDGRLAGNEESPVYGIKFASIQKDHTFLLYPARWFPVSEYTVDRYTMDLHMTVPADDKVVASGIEERPDQTGGSKMIYRYRYTQPSFPGSIAVVQGNPQKVSANGLTTTLYFRDSKETAQAYGQEVANVMTYFTSIFGSPISANLTVIETEAGTPNGYSAPGLLFLSPKAIGKQVNTRVLSNAIARQWWGTLLGPTSRNHIWLINGMARYAEMLYMEHNSGSGALETEVRDDYIEALTVDNPPVIQAARLEDYSPEYWAVTGAKGAAIFHMLRTIMGDKPFEKLLHTFTEANAYKSVNTEQFKRAAEAIYGDKLQGFFVQWTESTGAPEFKLDYTVFRTQKGFRVMGKVAQDLDTFRMPVEVKIETEGNPETKRIDVVGTSSEFTIDTFGKPKKVYLDPNNQVLRYSSNIRVAVAIKRGEQFAQVGEFTEALKEYQKALDVSRNSSLAHYRVGEVFMLQNNYQSAANEFRQSYDGDLEPKWTEVWSRINLGNIFDITGQRERAVSEYNQAIRTKDNTQDAQAVAAKYLKTPYERKSTLE